VISDSHDRMEYIEKAIKIFNTVGVEAVLHAGDIVSPFTIRAFKQLNCPMHIVWGNNDGDKESLKKFFDEIGVFHGYFADLTFNGRKIFMLHGHGDVENIKKAIVNSGFFHVLIYGHTHNPEIKKVGNCLILNPGELCGYLTGKSTIAFLDLEKLEAEIEEVKV